MKDHASNNGLNFPTKNNTYQAGLQPILPQSSTWSLSERCPEINVNIHISLLLWPGLLMILFCVTTESRQTRAEMTGEAKGREIVGGGVELKWAA